MKKIAIFASGNGTNAQRITDYFRDHPSARVELILSNNPSAFVLQRAAASRIPSVCFTRKEFYESNFVLDILSVQGISFVVLAGFLWLVPGYILDAYEGRIVNIHPALLPNYGGKGMYGMKVHEAVIRSGDRESGITIHHVNRNYDEGGILFQAKCTVDPEDTPETLAAKIHELEYEWFPKVVEAIVLGKEIK